MKKILYSILGMASMYAFWTLCSIISQYFLGKVITITSLVLIPGFIIGLILLDMEGTNYYEEDGR